MTSAPSAPPRPLRFLRRSASSAPPRFLRGSAPSAPLRTLRFLFGALCLAAPSAPSEYRVAYLIDTEAPKTALEKAGFKVVVNEVPHRELHRKIDHWTRSTPVNSTAVVYVGGKAIDSRHVAQAVKLLATQGGSRRSFLLFEAAPAPKTDHEIPADVFTAVAAADEILETLRANGVEGAASKAVAPRTKMPVGRKAGDEWVNRQGMVFCWIPPGKATLGIPDGVPGRYPDEGLREVTISHGFWMSKYETTRGITPKRPGGNAIGTHKLHPVDKLHWDDGSRMFTRTLTETARKSGDIPADWEYSLPTGDEWEYAARAGATTLYHFGDDVSLLPRYANFADKRFFDSGDIFSQRAHRNLDDGQVRLVKVGSYLPNAWGLHDVHGNVMEWCIDRESRGGGWCTVAVRTRCGARDSYSSRDDQTYLGYRPVLIPARPPAKKK